MLRTGKYANIEGVEVKVDGEGLDLPSSSSVDRDGDGDGFEKKRHLGQLQPPLNLRLTTKENLTKQKSIFQGGTGVK